MLNLGFGVSELQGTSGVGFTFKPETLEPDSGLQWSPSVPPPWAHQAAAGGQPAPTKNHFGHSSRQPFWAHQGGSVVDVVVAVAMQSRVVFGFILTRLAWVRSACVAANSSSVIKRLWSLRVLHIAHSLSP